MKLRIRLQVGPAFERQLARNREFASVLAMFLTPLGIMALALGVWRLGSDLKWTGEFAISRGIFSHWQVWLAMAVLIETCAAILNRYGRGGGEATP